MKLPAEVAHQFREHHCCAVYVASSSEIVSRKLGDNAGGWPVKVGITVPFEDRLTNQLLFASPYVDLGVQFRVWVMSESMEESKALAGTIELATKKHLLRSANAIRRGWADMDQDFEVAKLESWMHAHAKRLKIAVWNDVGVVARLREIASRDVLKRGVGAR